MTDRHKLTRVERMTIAWKAARDRWLLEAADRHPYEIGWGDGIDDEVVYQEAYELGRRDGVAETESNKAPPSKGTVRPFGDDR